MKKMQRSFWVLIILYTLACNSKPIPDNQERNIKEVSTEINIVLLLFPSGCENESCYSYIIEIGNNSYNVGGNYYIRYPEDKKKKELSIQEIDKLNEIVKRVQSPYFNKKSVEDVWGAKMLINGKVLFEEGEFSFDSPPNEIKQLINYIVKLSPLEIVLYDFS